MRASVKALRSEYDMPIFSLSSDWAWAYAAFPPTRGTDGRGVEFPAQDAKLARELRVHTILMRSATSRGPRKDYGH